MEGRSIYPPPRAQQRALAERVQELSGSARGFRVDVTVRRARPAMSSEYLALADAPASEPDAALPVADAPCQPVAALRDIPYQSPLDAHPAMAEYIQRQAKTRGNSSWRRILHNHLYKSKKAGGHVIDGTGLKDHLHTSPLEIIPFGSEATGEDMVMVDLFIANSFVYGDGAACAATAIESTAEAATETVCKEVLITLFVNDAINNYPNSRLALSQLNWHASLAVLLQETRRLLRDSIAGGPPAPGVALPDGQLVAPGRVGAGAQPGAPIPMPLPRSNKTKAWDFYEVPADPASREQEILSVFRYLCANERGGRVIPSQLKTRLRSRGRTGPAWVELARLLEAGSMLRFLQAHSHEFGYAHGKGPEKLHSFWMQHAWQATSQGQPVAPPAKQPPSGQRGCVGCQQSGWCPAQSSQRRPQGQPQSSQEPQSGQSSGHGVLIPPPGLSSESTVAPARQPVVPSEQQAWAAAASDGNQLLTVYQTTYYMPLHQQRQPGPPAEQPVAPAAQQAGAAGWWQPTTTGWWAHHTSSGWEPYFHVE